MRRFVRVAAIAFTPFSALFWNAASSLAGVYPLDPDALGLRPGTYLANCAVYAVPAILYGALGVLYFHWFAGRVARLAFSRKSDV